MKWGLFLISLGLLLIGVSGSADGGASAGLLITGIIVALIGLAISVTSNKYKKYAERKASLELESREYAKEQEAIRKQKSLDKMNENVLKSREASAKHSHKEDK